MKVAPGSSEVGAVVASDEKNDLALIRLRNSSNPLPSVAVFREGAPVRAGDAIVALGYPLSGLLANAGLNSTFFDSSNACRNTRSKSHSA